MVQPVYSDACATSSSANEAYGCAGCALPLCFEEVPPIRLKVTVVHTNIGGSMLITCYIRRIRNLIIAWTLELGRLLESTVNVQIYTNTNDPTANL